MLKSLLRDSFVYTLSSVLSRGIVFFLLPILAKYLSPKEFGVLDLFVIFIALVGVTIGGELSQGLSRFTPEAKHERKSVMISTVLWTTIALYLLFITVGCIFPKFFTNLIVGDSGYSRVLVLVFFLTVFIKIEYILRSQLRWDLKVKTYAYISIVYTLIHAISVYVALAHYNLGIFGYFLGQFFATMVALILSLLSNKKYIKITYSVSELRDLFKFSYPLVFSSLTIILATYVDRLVIKELLSLKELGLYGMGYRFASMGSFLLVGVQGALMPIIYKEYKKESTKDRLKDFFYLFYAVILSILVIITFFSKELLVLMTSPEYYSVDFIIPVLCAAVLFNGMYVFGVGITIEKKTKIFLYVGVFSLIMNLILNYLLIPIYGVSGAAFGTLITAVLNFMIYMYFSQKYYPVSYNYPKLIWNTVIVVLVFYSIRYLWTQYFDQITILDIMIKFTFALSLSFVLFYGVVGRTRLSVYINRIKSKFITAE